MTLTRRLPNRGTRFADLMPTVLKEVGRKLDAALDRIEKVTQGLPQLHESTHLQGGSDPFPAPAPPPTIDPNLASSAGTATNYARSDVRPGIDLKLTTKGDSLTFDGSGYLREAVGAPGTVHIADPAQPTGRRWGALVATPDIDGVRAFLPHPPAQQKVRAGTNVTIVEDALGVIVSATGGGGAAVDDASNILANRVFGG
jgi:hypothetical protein